MQIGISQGRMRAGVYSGTHHRTYGVLGDEVNMAARLMMMAQPGQILVSDAAYESIANAFRFDTLPLTSVKGRREPMTLFALLERHTTTPTESSSYTLPLVGRTEELQQIERLLANVKLGHGQILALEGEAGVGKSRLIAEVIQRATDQGWAVHSGACESYGANSSYLVWHAIWRGLLGIDATAATEKQINAVTEWLHALNPHWVQRLPLLDVILQLPIAENNLTRSLDARLRKTSLHYLLIDLLRSSTATQPTLIVLEDCDWLDPLSYELFQALSRAITDRPVCIALVCRELSAERSEEIAALSHATQLQLEQFSHDEAAQLMTQKLLQLSGSESQVPEELVERLVEQSQGNPFYLEELTTYLYYHGLPAQNGHEPTSTDLPDSLQRLVLSRLDQLSESQKITARVASVVGRVFRAAWLWGAYPTLGDPVQVQTDLTALYQQDLTVLDPAEPELTYFFKQVITQSVTYESLPHAIRAAIHDHIGQFIETIYAETLDQYLDLLAHHYDNSDNTAKRREYLLRAAEAAQAQYANLAAIDYYRRVLPLLSAHEQIDVQLKLSKVLEVTGQWDEAKTYYQRALDKSQQSDDQSAQARCEMVLGELLHKQGEFDEAWTWLGRAKSAFEALDDPAGVGQVLHYMGTMAAKQGDYERSHTLYHQSLIIRRTLDDRRSIGRLLSNLGIVARRQGNLSVAQSLYEQSLAVRRELDDRSGIAITLNNLGNLTLDQGDLNAARQLLEEAVAIHRQVGDLWEIGNSLNNLGNVVRAQGDYAAARALYGESLTINHYVADKYALAYLFEDVGCLLALQGQSKPALRLVAAAFCPP